MPAGPLPGAAGPRAAAYRGIPVGLKEAVLDSPAFRASAAHFADQVDALEKWLNGYASSTSKLVHDMLALEDVISSYLAKTMAPPADGIVDNDYTLLALRRVGDGQRECWMQILGTIKKMEAALADPIRSFLALDMRNFKEVRRVMEQSQRAYDANLARYVGQSKTKEASALREDAFALYETRKAYVQASMEFGQLAPQLRFTADKLLLNVCHEAWDEMGRFSEAAASATRWGREMDRVWGWTKEMEISEAFFSRGLQAARRELTETALDDFKPSRELDAYNTSTVPFLGSRGLLQTKAPKQASSSAEKFGWLFLRVSSGKPVRYNWVRRWYYCRDGVFGWLVPGPQGGVLQGDEIGVLLCNAKPVPSEERRFCFEVKTKNQTMLLQAETQLELSAWLEVFEAAKKQAFETSMSYASDSSAAVDPAFSISPPSAPEFSAKAMEGPSGAADEAALAYDRSATLMVTGGEGQTGAKQGLDVNSGIGRRSFTTLGRELTSREDGEKGREHGSKIIQRLDLHRKATFGGGGSGSGSGGGGEAGSASPSHPGGGIASLITASHNLLPVHPAALTQGVGPKPGPGSLAAIPGGQTRSLAPLTLAKPPLTTSLSRTAVLVTAEGGSAAAGGRRVPTSIVANYWGSSVWAGEAAPEASTAEASVAGAGSQTAPGRGGGGPAAVTAYPNELRAHSAQFRLLFPGAAAEEQLVLVFRAAWSSSSMQEGSSKEMLTGDGRIYVTPDNMYFYGRYMGLVTAYGIHLDIITEVTVAPGKECDFLFLRLGRAGNNTGASRITVKVFLEDVRLLLARINLLVDNLQAEEPLRTGDLITALVQVGADEPERVSSREESWEGSSSPTSALEGTSGPLTAERGRQEGPSGVMGSGPPKLHLPTNAVVYVPENMTEMAAERHFEISAKACFHALFGDRSFLFPRLYFERRARQIVQGPWVLADQGLMRREFRFEVDYVDMLRRTRSARVDDYQLMDVYREHVTYAVTHSKTAWHLPHSRNFRVLTTLVITHVAKSKCKLAVYIKIDWSKSPTLSRSLVERQALKEAGDDAEELAELATDQVRKLGPRSRTKRAIEVYGQVGAEREAVIFSPPPAEPSKTQAVKPRTLTAMMVETAMSFAESAISSVIIWALAGLRRLLAVLSAQRLLCLVLGLSLATNLLLTSAESRTWWRERRAARYMTRLGVGPQTMMSKAIYMADLEEASGARVFGRGGGLFASPSSPSSSSSSSHNNSCLETYGKLLQSADLDAPWEEAGAGLQPGPSRATARRLRRTRQRLGTYRHDLLVAMRVVNRLERDVVEAERENWLLQERALCDELEGALGAEAGPAKSGRLASLDGGQRRLLDAWRDDYCASCREALDALGDAGGPLPPPA